MNYIDFPENLFRKELALAPPHLRLGVVRGNAVANVTSVLSALPRGYRWAPASPEGFLVHQGALYVASLIVIT